MLAPPIPKPDDWWADRPSVRLKALLGTFGCVLVLVMVLSVFASASSIAPASLVVQRGQLPGFTTAKVHLLSTSSAEDYDGRKAVELKRDGFQKGVLETLTNGDALATSQAAVFHTPHGATEAFKAEVAPLLTKPTADIRFRIPAIPGAFAVLELNLSDPPGYLQNADVLFTTGRCLEHVATGVFTRKPYSTARQVDDAAIASATALYRRVKRVCA